MTTFDEIMGNTPTPENKGTTPPTPSVQETGTNSVAGTGGAGTSAVTGGTNSGGTGGTVAAGASTGGSSTGNAGGTAVINAGGASAGSTSGGAAGGNVTGGAAGGSGTSGNAGGDGSGENAGGSGTGTQVGEAEKKIGAPAPPKIDDKAVKTKVDEPAVPSEISYTELYDKLNPRPEYDEAKEKKRQKREKIVSLIGDGLTAISDIIFGTKGAKGVSSSSNSLSAATKAKWEKLKAEREKNLKTWQEGHDKATDRDRQWAEFKEKRRKNAEDSEYKKRSEERDIEKHNSTMAYNKVRTEGQEINNNIAKSNSEYAPLINETKLNKAKADVDRSEAQANYYNNGGSKGSRSSESGEKEFLGMKYKKNDEYKTAVMTAVRRWNEAHPDKPISLKKSVETTNGYKKTVKEVDRKIEDLASEVIVAMDEEQDRKNREEKKRSYQRKKPKEDEKTQSKEKKADGKVGAKFDD